MTPEKIERLKSELLRYRIELLDIEEMSGQSTGTVTLDQSRVGRLSRMDALQNQQIALEAERRRKQQISRIDEALERIAQNEFGYCLCCGEEIDIRRLELEPAHKYCFDCADKLQN